MCEWRADQLFAEAYCCRNNILRLHIGEHLPVNNLAHLWSGCVFFFWKVIKILVFFLNFTSCTVIVINCTSLTQMVDPGGPLRMSSCANHFGTQCKFSCAIGCRLNGSSIVTCVAPGNQYSGVWNNTMPTCKGKQEKRKKDG